MRRVGISGVAAAAGGVALTGLLLAACQNYGQPKTVADASGAEAIPDKPDYSWDVRPILSQNCFQCHGNDPKNRKAGLRLDLGEGGAFEKLKDEPGKRAIVPGNPKKSVAFLRMISKDPDFRMPPRDAHKTVSPRDVAVIERWIKQGAKYKPHWAYIPVKEVKPEKTSWDKQAVNQIDRYTFAQMKKHGLSPSKEADKETLINRVTLDLTGLPPTLQEVDAFIADTRPDAYERVVDRLLNSTAYAERQANQWMDVARYADTRGGLNDGEQSIAFPYRDWVISAFKRNIPYDKFVTWQLAGDKLPNPTREQILATSFVRAGLKNNEGGAIDEEFRVEYMNERTELVGKAFLGLTVGCAKCHDHKYDIISQADYYSMGGFFNQLDERGIHSGTRGTPMGPTLAWPTPTQAKTLATADAATKAKWDAYQTALAGARQRAAAQINAIPADQRAAFVTNAMASDTQAYYPLDSGYKGSFAALMLDPDPPTPGDGRPGVKRVTFDQQAKGKGRESRTVPDNGSEMDAAHDPALPRLAYKEIEKTFRDKINSGYVDDRLTDPNAIRKHQLLVGLNEAQLFWTADGRPNAKPGFLNNAKFTPGVKGQGVVLNDTVVAADKGVGQFERTDPYTIDLWVKLRAKPYDDGASIISNMSSVNGNGYQLTLTKTGTLRYDIIHQAPYNQLQIETAKPLPAGKWTHVTVTYDGNSKAAGLKLYVDGQLAQTQVLHDHLTRSSKTREFHNAFGSYYGLSLGKNFGRLELKDSAIDELRVFTRALTPLEVATLQNAAAVNGLKPDAVRAQMIEIAAAKDPAVVKAWQDLSGARLAEQKVETPIYQLMVAGDVLVPRKNYVLDRGVYNAYKEEVPSQALPKVFAWSADLPRNRLGLAQWLFNPKHPLTSRVYVNRLWASHFGTGIVQTVEDFGTQGANPSNPELLDYLAAEFIRSGWDIKHMHKLMVMSATYRQDSTTSKDALEKDPKNVYLARGPRYRMSAEQLRDNALFASGLLVNKVGGDSVFPYQPAGVWDGVGTGVTFYPEGVPKDELHRRTMYSFIKRNALHPALAVFDMPDRQLSTVARNVSNTPLQALVLLNDEQFVEAYRKVAERAMKSGADADKQLVVMYRLVTRRHPTDKELATLKSYYAAQLARATAEPDAVKKLLAVGVAPADASLDQPKLAAMTMATAVVFNTPAAYNIR